jgi:hypothetical protein
LASRIIRSTGMLLAAVAVFGLSRLTATANPNDTIVWFVLLGLGLSPVMVGATEVIVGNAPVELAGVASGLQSTAMQLSGTLGTAILGAVMSAKISSLLPASWAAAHLPALSPAHLAGVKSAVSVVVAPVTQNTPPRLAAVITQISHDTFVAGMHTAFLVAAAVALAGALIALFHVPAGQPPEPGLLGEVDVPDLVQQAGHLRPGAGPEQEIVALGDDQRDIRRDRDRVGDGVLDAPVEPRRVHDPLPRVPQPPQQRHVAGRIEGVGRAFAVHPVSPSGLPLRGDSIRQTAGADLSR